MVNISEDKCIMCGRTIPEGRMVCKVCEDMEPSFETVVATISLDKITDIKDFVELVSKCPSDVAVKSGNFAVNAKSIMGLFSLDLSKPLRIEFFGRIPYEVREGLKKFVV